MSSENAWDANNEEISRNEMFMFQTDFSDIFICIIYHLVKQMYVKMLTRKQAVCYSEITSVVVLPKLQDVQTPHL